MRFLPIVLALERTNQLSFWPDKDLVDLCPPIEPYQVTKNHIIVPLKSLRIEVEMADIYNKV
ncbi:MAG: hypothetical protein EWV55_00645 [Microcystis viridis Mv_BB_P_19951000_S69]|nr:MAG: hypothetical protein EWV55_00645 [Microcystis viridis Mv_BB_P_19951000_S69]TRU82714.1 MAG: hypothetical protein EWV46_18255 [Microcystis viridis Mv_BB_P_19951000_S69D]